MRLDRQLLVEDKTSITIQTLKKKMKDVLPNIEITDRLADISQDGKVEKDRVLNIRCKHEQDPKHEKMTSHARKMTVKDLEAYEKNRKRGATTGGINPCPIENREIKSENRPSNLGGNFDSKEEAFVYKTVKGYIDNNAELFKGCTLYPVGFGNKMKLGITGKNRDGSTSGKRELDADIYIKFPEELVNMFKTKLGHAVYGHAFMIDGPTHYGPSVRYSVFTNDQARDLQTSHFVTRVETRDIGKNWENRENAETVQDGEISSIRNYIYRDLEKTKKAIMDVKRSVGDVSGYFKDHNVSKAKGEYGTVKQSAHEDKRSKIENQLERIIFSLKNREHTTPYRDRGDYYFSEKGQIDISDMTSAEFGKLAQEYLKTHKALPEKTKDFIKEIGVSKGKKIERKLSSFLRTPKGRASYSSNQEIWGQVVDATPKELQSWKEKYQAKNGEKLNFKDKESLKLFENEKDR